MLPHTSLKKVPVNVLTGWKCGHFFVYNAETNKKKSHNTMQVIAKHHSLHTFQSIQFILLAERQREATVGRK